MASVWIGKTKIQFQVKRSRKRKMVAVAVNPDNGVVVTAPEETSIADIEKIVESKAQWIFEKRAKRAEMKEPPKEKEYLSGEKLPYLGRRYRLQVVPREDVKRPSVKLKNGRFRIRVESDLHDKAHRREVKDALQDWYLKHAGERIPERVHLYAPKVGVEPRFITVKEQQKRWGSCNSMGDLYYNWRIIMAPMRIVDYVVVHELCHLKEKNHSEKFWRHLQAVLPDYEERKEWLRVNGPTLILP